MDVSFNISILLFKSSSAVGYSIRYFARLAPRREEVRFQSVHSLAFEPGGVLCGNCLKWGSICAVIEPHLSSNREIGLSQKKTELHGRVFPSLSGHRENVLKFVALFGPPLKVVNSLNRDCNWRNLNKPVHTCPTLGERHMNLLAKNSHTYIHYLNFYKL